MKRPAWILAASKELAEQGWWPEDAKRIELVAAIIEKHANPKVDASLFFGGDPKWIAAWASWVSYLTKKKHNRRPTDHTLRLHLKKLESMSLSQAIFAIERAMESGWSCIFPVNEIPFTPTKALKSMSPPVEPPPDTARTKEIYFLVSMDRESLELADKARLAELASQLTASEWASLDGVTERELTALLREVPA